MADPVPGAANSELPADERLPARRMLRKDDGILLGRTVAGALFGLALGWATPGLAIDNSFEMGPGGVVVPVRLTERISSQDATAGQTFGYETTAAVTVDGIRIPAKTPGTGVVAFASSGRGPVPGRLRLAAVALHLANGSAIAVGFEESEAGTVSAADSAHAAGVAVPSAIGTIVVGGIVRGNNVVYEKGTRFTLLAPPPATPEPEPDPAAS
jgi:hypothetical protein